MVLPTSCWFFPNKSHNRDGSAGQATELQEALDAKELKKMEEELGPWE